MSFRWNEYLRLAYTLQAAGDEASLRSAVSRAYYANFHAALDYTERKGFYVPTQSPSDHGAVRDVFRDQARRNVRNAALIAQLLSALREQRNEADYSNSIRRMPDYAANSLKTAEELAVLLAGLS